MNKVYIIIVTYNGMPWIQKCMDSCKGHSIVIVDNNSTDDTVSFIKKNFPEVYLLPQSKNLGFGQANNRGISYALNNGAQHVFLLNQDAYLGKGCIETMVTVQKQNPDYGILSPIHLNGIGDRLDQGFSEYVTYENNVNFYSDFVLRKPLHEVYEVPFVNAAGWLLSLDILEKVGGFDPIFFHYGEDDNYCQRAHYHNFKIGVVPKAFLQHDREDRKVSRPNKSEFFRILERRLKNKYGNINVNDLDRLRKLLKKREREHIKTFLKLRFSKLDITRNRVRITSKVLQEVTLSWKTNRTQGKHYIE